jgi:hypothetical protein
VLEPPSKGSLAGCDLLTSLAARLNEARPAAGGSGTAVVAGGAEELRPGSERTLRSSQMKAESAGFARGQATADPSANALLGIGVEEVELVIDETQPHRCAKGEVGSIERQDFHVLTGQRRLGLLTAAEIPTMPS